MLKKRIIELLGGYPDFDSAIRALRAVDDVDAKRAILTEAIKHLYIAISPDDILKQNVDGTWMFQGRPLTHAEVTQLKEEAAMLRGMRLWRVLKWDIRYQLGKRMFEEARLKDDLVWGQLLTFLDDVIRTRIAKM